MKILYARFSESVKLSNKESLHAMASDFEIAILPKIGCMQLTALSGKMVGAVVVVPLSNVLYFTAEGQPEVEQVKVEESKNQEDKAEAEQAKVDEPKVTKPKPKPKPAKAVPPGSSE